jgi:hypothetical protein
MQQIFSTYPVPTVCLGTGGTYNSELVLKEIVLVVNLLGVVIKLLITNVNLVKKHSPLLRVSLLQ